MLAPRKIKAVPGCGRLTRFLEVPEFVALIYCKKTLWAKDLKAMDPATLNSPQCHAPPVDRRRLAACGAAPESRPAGQKTMLAQSATLY
jgi:predicted nucleic acid-binding Zn ribbon protein